MNNYLLAIRNNDGDYYPVRWELTPMRYFQSKEEQGQAPSLEVIDRYTAFHEADTLIEELLRLGAIDVEHQDKPLVIIYYDEGKKREVTNGVLYEQEAEVINSATIKDFILNNMQEKAILNKVYNKFANREENSPTLNAIMYLLNRIEYVGRNLYNFKIALAEIDELPYLERRNLGLYIKRNLLVKENNHVADNGFTLKKSGE